jgi:hypothetical protein
MFIVRAKVFLNLEMSKDERLDLILTLPKDPRDMISGSALALVRFLMISYRLNEMYCQSVHGMAPKRGPGGKGFEIEFKILLIFPLFFALYSFLESASVTMHPLQRLY